MTEAIQVPNPAPVVSLPASDAPPTSVAVVTISPELAPVTPVVAEKTAEEKTILANAEEEKRRARAARFGGPDAATTKSVEDKRAERFGTALKADEAVDKVRISHDPGCIGWNLHQEGRY